MRSLVLDFDRRELREAQSAEPSAPRSHHALLRVHEVGICGTDRELVRFGLMPRPGDRRRIVLGHEALAQVVTCGEGVETLAPGDWVVPTVRRNCAPCCSSCARGRSDLCLTGGYAERGIFGLDGYYAEFAVDDAADLVRVPDSLLPFAVLLEPLSVVEKSVERIAELRQSDGRKALVLGLGSIGLLTAMVLGLRGYEVTVYSSEPEDHPRRAMLETCGVRYTRALEGRFDVIVEATGSAEVALAALGNLGACGVFITLGARRAYGEISFIDLIVGNQTVAGIVNASRPFFELGVRDLGQLPRAALGGMIRRFGFGSFEETLFGSPAAEPKFVHVIADSLH